jgi:PAS domain-containing protein
MSHDSLALQAIDSSQPVAPREHVSPTEELHPRCANSWQQARLAAAGSLELTQLLPLISAYYEQLDDERRGVVRSMQLIADEARSFGDGLAGADAGHLQAILDHIKDVVITVAVDGSVKIFNPTGERVFGYSRSEVIGQPIARLLPEPGGHAARSRAGWNRSPPGSRPTAATCARASFMPATRTATCFRPS